MRCIAKINSFVGSHTKAYIRNMLRYLLVLVVALIILITVFFMTKGSVEDVASVMLGIVISTFFVKLMRYNRQLAFTILEYAGKKDLQIKSLWVGGLVKEIKPAVNPLLFFLKKTGVVILLAIPFILATLVMFTIFKPVLSIQLLIISVGTLFIMFLNNGIVEPLMAICEISD